MPSHREVRDLPFTADQMFAVVADVEKYPQFLPWCAGLRVTSREQTGSAEIVIAEMLVAYHGLRERYTSRVTLDAGAGNISAAHIKGPFDHLDNRWRFETTANGCRVHFAIDFAFKSKLLSVLAGVAFDLAARKMADAFAQRAAELYGSRHLTA